MPRKRTSHHDVYEVEDILEYKKEGKTDFFKIKWSGYSLEDATWEPRKNIIEPDDAQKMKMIELKAAVVEKGRKRGNPNANEQETDKANKERKVASTMNQSLSSLPSFKSPLSHPLTPSQTKDSSSSEIPLQDPHSSPKSSIVNLFPVFTPVDNHSTSTDESLRKSENEGHNHVYVKVVHIRPKKRKLCVCVAYCSIDAVRKEWMPIEKAKALYHHQVLDYLLSRLRFRRKTRPKPNGRSQSMPLL